MPRLKHELEPGSGDTASRILAHARALFQTHGYAAVGTREIVEAAGATTPSLYHHFGSKEELFVQVSLGIMEQMGAELRMAIAGATDLRARLQRIARMMWEADDYQSLMMDAVHHLPVERRGPLRETAFRHFVAPIVGVMAEAIATRELPGGDPMFLAQSFMALIDGYRTCYLRGDPLPPPERNVAPIDLFLAGARALGNTSRGVLPSRSRGAER